MISTHDIPKQELVQLCQDLVRTPSVNGVYPERKVAELVAQFAKTHDLEVERVALEQERPNVLVRVGASKEVGLLLVAHTDTVSAGREESWTHPPFGADIVDGRLYGRGAVDNKGGLTAALATLLLLKNGMGKNLDKSVLLACVPDEESGASGKLGIKYLKQLGKLGGIGAIYTYPGTHQISIGHRGVLRLRIMTYGKAFHTGSFSWQQEAPGYNALSGMAEIITAIEGIKFKERGGDGLFSKYRTVITPTLMKGGSDRSIVPDYCEALIDIRLVPKIPREQVEEKICKVATEIAQKRPPLRVEIQPETYVPATLIPTEARVISALKAATKQILGTEPGLVVSGPANESYLLNEFGIPTCVFGPDGRNVHAADEYIEVDSIFQVASVYALTAQLLAG
jgi:succinyl-diaminopimelate desuccinylase